MTAAPYGATTALNGLLVVDKPAGWTSHDVVALVRAHTRVRKVGHAGTLDPAATGVLLVLVGRATKLADAWLTVDKEYVTTVTLGVATDSGDAAGRQVATKPVPALTRANIEAALANFRGAITQTPPMVSALKHHGRPLYWWARRGKTVDRAARPVQIHALDVLAWQPPRLTLRIACSKGTYVRTLAEDIAAALDTVGHLAALQRTRVGPYTIAQAIGPEWIRASTFADFKARLLPMASPAAAAAA